MKQEQRKYKLIACAIMVCYAVLVDLQGAILRSNARSIHDFQVLPMTIWGIVISVMAVAYVFAVFRNELRSEIKAYRQKTRKNRGRK